MNLLLSGLHHFPRITLCNNWPEQKSGQSIFEFHTEFTEAFSLPAAILMDGAQDLNSPMILSTLGCSSPTSSPIDQVLFDAAVDSPHAVGHATLLHQVFNDDGVIHEYAVDVLRHHHYDGPSAHLLDDGAQATTSHQRSHLFAYRTFSADSPCHTRLISANGHGYVPIGYGIRRVPAPNSIGYIPNYFLIYFLPKIVKSS